MQLSCNSEEEIISILSSTQNKNKLKTKLKTKLNQLQIHYIIKQTGERVAFDVDTSEAGVGALDVIVDGPSKVFITCDDTTSSPYLFHFEPPCPGIYKLEVVFDGMLVPQCSNKIHVKGWFLVFKMRDFYLLIMLIDHSFIVNLLIIVFIHYSEAMLYFTYQLVN